MIFLSVFIISLYSIYVLNFYLGFERVPEFQNQGTVHKTRFSILIPFRDEEKNLPSLLKSIEELQYPKNHFEVILINDDSRDAYLKIIEDFKRRNTRLNIRLIDSIRKEGSPKKYAIETAVQKAAFDWIITTDADCKVPENWLKNFDYFIQSEEVKMIAAPVSYTFKKGFLYDFQNLDFLSLQGATIGGFGIQKPFMCNGANLCYDKKAFMEVEGFKGNDNIASGDDVFLMEKMIAFYPKGVKYLKSEDSIVITKPQPDWKQLLNQRIRWAAKAGSVQSTYGKLVGLIVFTTNLYLIILFTLALTGNISWQHMGLKYLVKLNVDFLLLYRTATFFNQQNSMKNYLYSSLLYPFFSVFVALSSFFTGFSWKGRKFKK